MKIINIYIRIYIFDRKVRVVDNMDIRQEIEDLREEIRYHNDHIITRMILKSLTMNMISC